jgi:SAM-dependent methyltransferase
MKNEDRYYMLYEDRYRRIHEQGFEYWIYDPDEIPLLINSIDKFLDYAQCEPKATSIVELGCGQGFLAENLIKRGFRYLGVDVSEYAITKARQRAGAKGKDAFLLGDIIDLRQVSDDSFDVAIDNQCFHMLVTDNHRAMYLAEVKRVLKNGGKAYFREGLHDKGFSNNMTDSGKIIEKHREEYSTLHEYTAYTDGEKHIIHLPRIPARFNNEQGYRRELEDAGFIVEYFDIGSWQTSNSYYTQCVIYAGNQ